MPLNLQCIERAEDYGLPINRPRNFVFKGGLFQNRYNHKGQVKHSSYTKEVYVRFGKSFKAFVCKGYTNLLEYFINSKFSKYL